MRAGDVAGHGGQALEGVAVVGKQAFGGHRDLVLALAPFAQQDGAGGEIKFARLGAQFDLRMLGSDGLEALARGRSKTAEGSQKRFADLLLTRGLDKWRNGMGLRGFQGLGLKYPPAPAYTPYADN